MLSIYRQQTSSRSWSVLTGVMVLAFAAGCGDDRVETYPTEAIVLLDDEPFGPTRIQLVPIGEGGRTVAGEVGEDGKVTFTTYEIGDGAPAGEYRAVVGLVMAPPPKPFPVLYRNSEKSPIKVKIEPKEKNEVVIAMDSKAGAHVKNSDFDMLSRARQDPAFSAGAEGSE